MKRILYVHIALLIFISSVKAFSLSNDTIKMKIDSIANVYLSDSTNVGLIIGIYRKRTNPNDPVIPEIYSYGEVRKNSGITPDSLTIFKLGSIGKTFTATVLAYYLVHEPDNVKLSFPMNRYFPQGQKLPFWVPKMMTQDTFRITLLDLATHHSSLPDQPRNNFVNPPNYTVALLLQFLGSDLASYEVRPLPYQPGTHWLYSNTGFGTLGVVMERITALPYDSILLRVFCDSLSMPDTRVSLNPNQLSRLAVGYSNGDSTDFALATSPAFLGAGGNYSSMDDMMKYLKWNMGLTNSSLNNLLDTLHKERKNTAHSNAWVGLAWQMNYLRQGQPQKYIWKDGATRGYSTFICFVDSTETGVMVLSNSTNAVDPVGINVLRVLNPIQSVGIVNVASMIPEKYFLSQNYPNPFNPKTIINFQFPPAAGDKGMTDGVKLKVYDALGKEIATLVDEKLSAGEYEVEFDGSNLPSGIYFYTLATENFFETKRMILLK